MRILIVAHRLPNFWGGYYDFPLGLAYISAALKAAGFEVDCLNLNHEQHPTEAFISALHEKKPHVVGFGGLSPHFLQIEELVKQVRRDAPETLVIVGGGLVTGDPEVLYEAMRPDIAVIGEGEITIVELLRAIENGSDLSQVDGIIFREATSGELIVTTPRQPIANLDEIAFPDYEALGGQRYVDSQMLNDQVFYHPLETAPKMLPVISSRGCPYNCSFCFHPLGARYRMRSLDNFFEELDMLVKRYDLNYVTVYDELLSSNRARIEEFCRRIEPYGLRWMTQLRADSVDDALILMLKNAGANVISYGIESASNEVLKSMGKNTTIEQIDRALELTKTHGVGFIGNIIFGDRAETLETVAQSMAWYERHADYLLGIGMIVSYPGSPLYLYAKEQGLLGDISHFVSRGGAGVNVTTIPQVDFDRIPLRSSYIAHRALAHNRAKVIRSQVIGDDGRGGRLYTLETVCPKCGQTSRYRDFNLASGATTTLQCKHCLQWAYLTLRPWRDYARLGYERVLLAAPPRISAPVDLFFRRVVGLSKFTPQQNITRIRRFVAAKYGIGKQSS